MAFSKQTNYRTKLFRQHRFNQPINDTSIRMNATIQTDNVPEHIVHSNEIKVNYFGLC